MKKLVLSLFLTLAFSATSFAGVTVKTAGGSELQMSEGAISVSYDEDGNVIDKPEMSYIDPYYGNQGVSVNVEVREKYVPTGKMSVNGSFSVYGLKTAEAAQQALEKKFTEAKSALAQYGKMRKNYLSTYQDGGYDQVKSSFSGSLEVILDMKSGQNYGVVKDKFSDLGASNSYVNSVIDPEEAILIEEKNAKKLKSLIEKKRGVYETILGYKLGKITSLNISTWLDTYNFDEETGEFEAVVSAYATIEEQK